MAVRKKPPLSAQMGKHVHDQQWNLGQRIELFVFKSQSIVVIRAKDPILQMEQS